MHSVYIITSEVDETTYVGISHEPRTRWMAHIQSSKKKLFPLYAAMRTWGVDKFEMRVVAEYENRADALRHESGLVRFLRESGQKPYNVLDNIKSRNRTVDMS